MNEPRWAKAHDNGPAHGWPIEQVAEDLWAALCGVQAEPADLVDDDEGKCVLCVLAFGTQVAEAQPGVSPWRC